ncbi:MAG: Uridine kinase [Pseudomonadota bacterium]|jgi:pantothenate kinase
MNTLHLDAAITARLHELSSGPRRLLGVVGPPGAGKSTLAALMAQHLGQQAQSVPMDGFHLAQTELERLGRAQRKGAPDTFDAAGYAALLRRLRQQTPDEVVYAPDFRRNLEEPVAGALPVFAHTPLVMTEGNYLLLTEDGWGGVAQLLDEVWYLQVDAGLRLERLAQRHQQFGRSREQALAWIASTDEPNARRIEATSHRAQRCIRLDADGHTYRFTAS